MTISFTVHGDPGPQGSKRALGPGRMVEMSTKVKPWREAVKWAAIQACGGSVMTSQQMTGPVVLHVIFYFPRPKSHYRTGKHSHLLRDDAPTHKTSAPDLSKLIRSTEDAITDSGIWRDDALVVSVSAEKRYSTDLKGAEITVTHLR